MANNAQTSCKSLHDFSLSVSTKQSNKTAIVPVRSSELCVSSLRSGGGEGFDVTPGRPDPVSYTWTVLFAP